MDHFFSPEFYVSKYFSTSICININVLVAGNILSLSSLEKVKFLLGAGKAQDKVKAEKKLSWMAIGLELRRREVEWKRTRAHKGI